ncbi:MAG: hypothetical protein GVY31_06125 [Alphaproteobacteria bacterium]|nr:hypothetical protein [Alphaproteobacteria bacterium]
MTGRAERRRALYVFVLWTIFVLVGLHSHGDAALPTGFWPAGLVVTALLFALLSWLVTSLVRFTRSMAPILPLLVLHAGLAEAGLFDGLVPGRPELGGTLTWLVPLGPLYLGFEPADHPACRTPPRHIQGALPHHPARLTAV